MAHKTILIRLFLLVFFMLAASPSAEEQFSYEVTVRAEKIQAVSVFDTESVAFSNDNAPGRTLGDKLSDSAGVSTVNSGYPGGLTTAQVRGGPSSQSLFCVEDVPVNSVQSGVFDLSLFSPELFTGVDIVRGGSSSVFGANASAGYFNLLMPGMPRISGIEAGILAGSYGRRRGLAKLDLRLSPTVGISAAFLYETAVNDFPYTVGASNLGRKNAGLASGQAECSLFRQGPVWGSTLRFIAGHKRIGVPGDAVVQNTEAREDDDNFLVIFKNSFYLPVYTECSASWLSSGLHYDDPFGALGPVNADHLNQQYFFRFLQMADPFGLSLNYGVEARENLIHSTEIGSRSRFLGSQFFSARREFLNRRLAVSARYRIEYSTVYGVVFDYNAGFTCALPLGFSLKTGYGTAFREPTFNELYWPRETYAEGNTGLKPERSRNADLGLGWELFPFWSVKMSGFYNVYKNLITWAPETGGRWSPQNIYAAEFYGADISTAASLGSLLRGTFGFTRLYPINESPGPYKGKVVPYEPFDRIKAGLECHWRWFIVQAGYRYEGFSFTTKANTVSDSTIVKPRHGLDLSLSARIRGWTLSASAGDVLKPYYFSPYGQPVMGRRYTVELRYGSPLRKPQNDQNKKISSPQERAP